MKRSFVLLTFALALPAAGCYSDLDGYVRAAAKQSCKRQKRCSRRAFDEQHNGDMGRCRDDAEEGLYDAADLLEAGGWEYDQDSGQKCIAAYREFRYDCSADADRDIADDCADVVSHGF